MKRVKIEVTERDIRLGRARVMSTRKCPVARALKRTFKSEFIACGASYFSRSKGLRTGLPKKVSGFMYKLMDNPKSLVKPFSFFVSI